MTASTAAIVHRGQSRDAISASADRGARAGVSAVGLRDLGHPRQVLRRVIDGQLLVGGESWIDTPHPIRDPEQIHEMFRAADESRARRVGDRFGEGIQGAIRDQVETGVMGQITVVKDKPTRRSRGTDHSNSLGRNATKG